MLLHLVMQLVKLVEDQLNLILDLTIEGETVRKAHMIDARIVDGLVDLFYVYQLDVPSAPAAEDTE